MKTFDTTYPLCELLEWQNTTTNMTVIAPTRPCRATLRHGDGTHYTPSSLP